MLIDAGARINAAEVDGATPLYIAAQNGQEEIVKMLIEAGANINACEGEGATPVYIAA
jgi:ankyrin repeat protein